MTRVLQVKYVCVLGFQTTASSIQQWNSGQPAIQQQLTWIHHCPFTSSKHSGLSPLCPPSLPGAVEGDYMAMNPLTMNYESMYTIVIPNQQSRKGN